MKNAFMAGIAAPFAHLTGRAKAEESDEDKKKREDEKAKKAEDEKKDKEAKAKAEESDDDKKKREDDDKKAKADKKCDDDEEMKATAFASGIAAERTRWVGTLSHAAAGGRVEAAVTLLATTDLSSDQVVGMLNSLPVVTARGGIDARMGKIETPNPGAGGGAAAEGPQATAQAMTAVYDRAIGRKK